MVELLGSTASTATGQEIAESEALASNTWTYKAIIREDLDESGEPKGLKQAFHLDMVKSEMRNVKSDMHRGSMTEDEAYAWKGIVG